VRRIRVRWASAPEGHGIVVGLVGTHRAVDHLVVLAGDLDRQLVVAATAGGADEKPLTDTT
jgi:hypothetical protein